MNDVPREAPRVSIIIVTYDSSEVVLGCLELLGDLDSSGVEAIVVDNASSDDTVALIANARPNVRVIVNKLNLGFAKAVNIGVAAARGEFVVLLNPDAMLELGVLTSLMDEAASDREIGVIAPLLGDPAGRLRISSAGRDPSTWRMYCHYFGLARVLGRFGAFEGHYLLSRHLSEPRVVDWVSGACMVVPRRVWEAVGGMSERWFMYAEDLELCYRVRKCGFRVVLDPGLLATHLVGASVSGNHRSSDPSWVINLYDFFSFDIARSDFSRVSWRLIVSGGLLLRSVAYRIESISNSADRAYWVWESKRFGHFAAGAFRAPRVLLSGESDGGSASDLRK